MVHTIVIFQIRRIIIAVLESHKPAQTHTASLAPERNLHAEVWLSILGLGKENLIHFPVQLQSKHPLSSALCTCGQVVTHHNKPRGQCEEKPAEDVLGPVPLLVGVRAWCHVIRAEVDIPASAVVQKAPERCNQDREGYQQQADENRPYEGRCVGS